MKLQFIVGLLSTFTVFSRAEPSCHFSELEKCQQIGINYLHSLPKSSLPNSEEDLNVLCTSYNNEMDCYGKFRDSCTTPLQKEIISLISEGKEETLKELCTPGSNIRTKYLAHSECLNKVTHLSQFTEQIEYVLALLEQFGKVPTNQKLVFSCCGYIKSGNGIHNLIKTTCGMETFDAFEEMIAQITGQLPWVICNNFDPEEDRCKAVLLPDGSKPSEATKNSALHTFIRKALKQHLD